MKTLQDLYKEVMASEDLKKAFAQAAKDNKVADFLKAQGCDATEEEFKAFVREKEGSEKPLSEEDLENAAGGVNLAQSILGFGFSCLAPKSWWKTHC